MNAVWSLFIFEGLATLASCDVLCLQGQINHCRYLFERNIHTNYEQLCRSLDSLASCVRHGFRECGGEKHMTDDVDALLTVGEEICRPGSDLNLKTKKHGKCLLNALKHAVVPCTTEIVALTSDLMGKIQRRLPYYYEGLITYNNNIMEFFKKICNAFLKSIDCFYDDAKDYCGKDAVYVLRAIGDPIRRLFKNACNITINGGIDGKTTNNGDLYGETTISDTNDETIIGNIDGMTNSDMHGHPETILGDNHTESILSDNNNETTNRDIHGQMAFHSGTIGISGLSWLLIACVLLLSLL